VSQHVDRDSDFHGVLDVSEMRQPVRDALKAYSRSFGYTETGERVSPRAGDFVSDMRRLITFNWESIVTSYLGVFEIFIQCWALNYLLTIVEAGGLWTKTQADLARQLSPKHSAHRRPGVPHILGMIDVRKAPFPDVTQGLRALPSMRSDPRTGRVIQEPVDDELNAFNAIDFWRAYRNARVHRRGVTTAAFVRGYDRFWAGTSAMFPAGMPALAASTRMTLNYRLVTSVFGVHYSVARFLNDKLLNVSAHRRGHLLAPEPYLRDRQYPKPLPPPQPLLIDGDHPASVTNIAAERVRGAWQNPWRRNDK